MEETWLCPRGMGSWGSGLLWGPHPEASCFRKGGLVHGQGEGGGGGTDSLSVPPKKGI